MPLRWTEAYRRTHGACATSADDGPNGEFRFHCASGRTLHVEIRRLDDFDRLAVLYETPTLAELDEIRREFFEDGDLVFMLVGRHGRARGVATLWLRIGTRSWPADKDWTGSYRSGG